MNFGVSVVWRPIETLEFHTVSKKKDGTMSMTTIEEGSLLTCLVKDTSSLARWGTPATHDLLS